METYTFGTTVDISNYTSSNMYYAPKDGYAIVRSGNTVGNLTSLVINRKIYFDVTCTVANRVVDACVFVKKGMSLYPTTMQGEGGYVKFLPLE